MREIVITAMTIIILVIAVIAIPTAIKSLNAIDLQRMKEMNTERINDHIRIFHEGKNPEGNSIKVVSLKRKVMCDVCIKQAIKGQCHNIPTNSEYLIQIRGY